MPSTDEERIREYTFSEADLSLIRAHRGPGKRLGFAVTLAYMRYPGFTLAQGAEPDAALVEMVAGQLNIPAAEWARYAVRAETRREHLLELQAAFGYTTFTAALHREWVDRLQDVAAATDRGIVLATAMVDGVRRAPRPRAAAGRRGRRRRPVPRPAARTAARPARGR